MLADLSLYRDTNRLLVVFAPSMSDPRLVRQVTALVGTEAGFRERDLLDIVVLPTKTTARKALDAVAIRRKYHVGPKEFRAMLVGKDGTVAFSSKAPIQPKTLYARIDAMPMRRDEMRRREG